MKKGAVVGEDHLQRMLGEMCDPISGDPVGPTPILSDKGVPVTSAPQKLGAVLEF